ncbi:FRG domain-containing protein [Mesorhizobium sp. M1428]|uniref:FRG domain-containing protein n=1 Tax=Mesorhizobium sp. M1428 TaxID=2957102 RepID=UPI00333C0364
METIGEAKLWTFLSGRTFAARGATCSQVRHSNGFEVSDYLDLARRVAELQFLNRDYVLLFRGQSQDYKNDKGNSTLKPSLFRQIGGQNPNSAQLLDRFQALSEAERILTQEYEMRGFMGRDRLIRQRVLRWSILQHYEVCKTPVLDVSQSLRIAASFASTDATPAAFVFVLGVPNISGAITASAEAGVQIVRLASVCPPLAVRPHIQEGYLLGEYPEMTGYDQKQHYSHFEIDLGRRLIAKFRFNPSTFWKRGDFSRVRPAALYPNESDPVFAAAEAVRHRIVHVE